MSYAKFNRNPDSFIDEEAWFEIREIRKESNGSAELLLEDYDPFGRDFWIRAEDALEIRQNYEEPIKPKSDGQITKYLGNDPN
ncbi:MULTISPECIES: hypothetical protein [Bacillaceae]|uniref:Uncharacterized protein n=1 Tax=Alkalicoccobacillus plakortidis TaxID=444060 RepID=A0A9D5DP69_9BACI|nr:MULTISPECIES: hypothetical protein [Bacillaceae]KQL55940.1 hypothetical protein AN965_16840 [Alkalicoccobacillus plakortidis]